MKRKLLIVRRFNYLKNIGIEVFFNIVNILLDYLLYFILDK